MRRRIHNFWEQWQEACCSPDAWQDFFRDFMGTLPDRHWVFGGRRFKPWHMGQVMFNPFLAMVLSKGGGLLPLYVLHLLASTPRYGNELMQQIIDRTAGQWLANPGAIYPLLTMLEEQGLIRGEWQDPDKRTIRRYALTEAGREELARLKEIIRPRLREAIDILGNILKDLDEGDGRV